MNEHSFDLIGIFHQIFKKKVFVLSITIAALIISLIFCALQPNGYTSESIFIVKNPLLIDRNFVFRNTNFENKEFFASPDDVDNIKTIAKSDGLLWHLISKFDLKKVYGIEKDAKLIKKVRSNFKSVMEDTKNIEIYYTDTDPQRAADITNEARKYLESTFMDYFLTTNKDITDALKEKVVTINDTLRNLDNSIETLRASIGSYNQLLPNRGTTITTASNNVSAAQLPVLERIQELTAVKDKMAEDVAQYQSLINEYQVMANGKIHIFYTVMEGYVPNEASDPKTIIITAASTIAALFFASILVLLSGFYQRVMNSKEEKN